MAGIMGGCVWNRKLAYGTGQCMGISLLAFFLGIAVFILAWQPWVDHNYLHKGYTVAAVAANSHECAAVGRDILMKKGSAVDAAIATMFCEGIVCAQRMGLGGGFIAAVYDAKKRTVKILNAYHRAPKNATKDMFQNLRSKNASVVGGLAIAVPGELRGYGLMYEKYGVLPWAQLVKPTIDLCRRGHRVNGFMARALHAYREEILAEPSLREVFMNPVTGKVWVRGDVVRQPWLARTLDVIADEGPNALHTGTLVPYLASDINAFGGKVTEKDLNDMKPEWQEPIAVPLGDAKTLYTAPFPGSGAVLAFILNMLRGWAGKEDRSYAGPGTLAKSNTSLYWHRIVETFKYAYARRSNLGDIKHPNKDVAEYIQKLQDNLTSYKVAHKHRSRVNDARSYQSTIHYDTWYENPDDNGGAHIAVVASDGSAVSVTSSINHYWGCQRRSPTLGFILNNQMDTFSYPKRESMYQLQPSISNMLDGGLQPLSSLVPSIVLFDGNSSVSLVVGAGGGTKILSEISLVIMRTAREGRDFATVVEEPRLHHQLMPMELEYENGFDLGIIHALRMRGHKVVERSRYSSFAAVVGINRFNSTYVPMSDPRWGGMRSVAGVGGVGGPSTSARRSLPKRR